MGILQLRAWSFDFYISFIGLSNNFTEFSQLRFVKNHWYGLSSENYIPLEMFAILYPSPSGREDHPQDVLGMLINLMWKIGDTEKDSKRER